jgi:pimeloyl-ACP methyl ester carboxylesterase
MWLYNAKVLAERFRLYVIDTIGGPGKSRFNERYDKDFDDLRWIDEVLDAFKLDEVYMAGVSNGAYLTQYYGANRPGRVSKIVCMAGTVPVGNESPLKAMMKIFLPEALFPTKKNTAKLLEKLCGNNVDVFLDNELVMEHYEALLKGFNNMAMMHHKVTGLSDEQVDAIRSKTLYLVGAQDPFAILGGESALMRYHMNTRYFPIAGHAINHEIPEEINEAIFEYLLCE